MEVGLLMGLMFVLGLILTIYGFKISDAVDKCSSNKVRHSARGLLVMGVLVMAVSGTMMAVGGSMYKMAKIDVGVMSLMLIAGITVLTMVSIVHKDCPHARKDTPVLMTLASLVSVVSLGYLGYTGYKQFKPSEKVASFHF
jgi:cytochrome bd-type quinol oxidase subunit 2